MKNKQVYILDNDSGQSDELFKLIAEDGYECRLFNTIDEIHTAFTEKNPSLFLLDYPTLLLAKRENVIRLFQVIKQQEIAVYNVPSDATRRLAFYELGARRVYDSGHSLQEIYFSLRWLLRIISDSEKQQLRHSHGNLEDISLATLIPMLAFDRRSGILTLQILNGSGKIYLLNGNIVDAQTGPHTGEDAFYQMLLWNTGKFIFLANEEFSADNRITLSNYGLLYKGNQLRNQFFEQLEDFASLQSIMRANRLGDLQLSNLEINPDFINFIKRPRQLNEIIENSFYTAYQTLNILFELNQNGFLLINPGAEPKELEDQTVLEDDVKQIDLNAKELEAFKENLQISDEENIKIVVISAGKDCRVQFIDEIAGSHQKSEGSEALEFGRVRMNKTLSIYLMGLEINQTTAESINQIFGGLAGFVFMIDASAPEQFEYINYVMNQILTTNPLPAVVSLVNIPENESVHSIRKRFITPEKLTWIKKPDDPLHLLFSIYPFEMEEEVESENEDEKE